MRAPFDLSNLELEQLSQRVRLSVFKTILNAGSGHIGGSSSSLETMVTLYFGGVLRFDPKNPRHPERDRVLLRGHLGPLRYSIFSLLGWVSEEELKTYRSFGSRLQGHESMEHVPGVDITPSGSLGMVLSYGVGSALALRELGLDANIYAFLGDGEEQEGNVSEAASHASHLGLTNLVCIIDKNRKQLSRSTAGMDNGVDLARIWEGYGWDVKEIQNGHSVAEIKSVLQAKRNREKPTLIMLHSVKGYGLRGAEEHFSGYHTLSTCPKEYVAEAIAKIESALSQTTLTKLTREPGTEVSEIPDRTRWGAPVNLTPGSGDHFDDVLSNYLKGLVALFKERKDEHLYVMTADWNNESVVQECGLNAEWVRYVDVGIREQHMIAMAHGIAVTDPEAKILIIDGDGFALRYSDQLHAASQARSRMVIVSTDSGICEARNGSTHQSTGQPGAMLNMPGLTFLEPADAVDLYGCLNWAFSGPPGPVYIRLHSTEVPRFDVHYRDIEYYIAYQPKGVCDAILIGSGLPLRGAVELARKMSAEGRGVRVINVVNPKSLDSSFVCMLEDGVPVLTLYNGNPHALQSAVAKAVMEFPVVVPSSIKGHGFTFGTTGKLEDLVRHFQFDAAGIAETLNRFFPDALE